MPSLEAALEIVGGLSRTRKMPCHSWGIPATTCKTGSVLTEAKGSVCGSCYALRGNYQWPNVQAATTRRLALATHPEWVEAMVTLVAWQARVNCQPYFRWFDSGDLQSLSMLERIARVARATPDVQHWLPTREYRIVDDYQGAIPSNLTVRVSAHLVDAPPPRTAYSTSTVHRTGKPVGYVCPAYSGRPATCFTCRACWDPQVRNVSYPLH